VSGTARLARSLGYVSVLWGAGGEQGRRLRFTKPGSGGFGLPLIVFANGACSPSTREIDTFADTLPPLSRGAKEKDAGLWNFGL
jgi:hypothetical protein